MFNFKNHPEIAVGACTLLFCVLLFFCGCDGSSPQVCECNPCECDTCLCSASDTSKAEACEEGVCDENGCPLPE